MPELDLRIKPTPAAPGWQPEGKAREIGFGPAAGWQSNGGYARKHPARGLPFSVPLLLPDHEGRPSRLKLAGIFALYSDPTREPYGAIGGTLHFMRGEEVLHRLDLIQGRHYGDSSDQAPVYRLNGDGSSVETIDYLEFEGERHRVDLLTLDFPSGLAPDRVSFHDLGTSASFVLFGAKLVVEEEAACPFRGHSGRVALSELPGILRLRDRPRLERAIAQAEDAVVACESELDEAKGQALAFVGALATAMLEFETDQSRHRELLVAARQLEDARTSGAVAEAMAAHARILVSGLFEANATSGDQLVDKALEYLDKYYASVVNGDEVADQIGLSTSHFRTLFRRVTGQPFNRYLLNLRLEKAREMLIRGMGSVAEVGQAVGFTSPAHFSRAFARRFGSPPSQVLERRSR
jgi:AraC-like DNA-binding protein